MTSEPLDALADALSAMDMVSAFGVRVTPSRFAESAWKRPPPTSP